MKRLWLPLVIVLAASQFSWALYGPSLARTDIATAARACVEGNMPHASEVAEVLQSGDAAKMIPILVDELEAFRATHFMEDRYAARAFCIHELIPDRLPREGEIASPGAFQPTALVKRFKELGIEYFYYSPDAEWTLEKNPVDLNALASAYLESEWGRQAFLMLTLMGWSQGACGEGPDQFREVINHGEKFLVEYPESEVSDSIRLELANAYATWWNLSRVEPNPPYEYPEIYRVGAGEAKQRAIELYQGYLKLQKKADPEIEKRLKALRENPKGSDAWDYYCPDYED
jgi:hypothetical protein